MTEAEFRAWVNTYINTNGSKSITGTLANEFFQKCIEFFAHVDTPLLPYTTTIANADLVAGAVTISHNKNTKFPLFIIYDETNSVIYSEYYDAQAIDANNILITFHAAIPATGNGYYTLTIWSAGIIDITPRYTEVFSSNFSAWTGNVPDNFTLLIPSIGSPTIENDANRVKLTLDGVARIKVIPTLALELNREYRITINVVSGNLVINCGSNNYTIATTGVQTIYLIASATSLSIRQGGSASVAIFDDLVIEEKA